MMETQSYWKKLADRRSRRRQLLGGTLAFAAAIALEGACRSAGAGSSGAVQRSTPAAGGAAFSGPPAKMTVSVGAADSGYTLIYLAREAEIFKRNGLEVDIQVIPGPNAIAALVSGQLQVATAGAGETLGASVEGASLSIVASPSPTFAGYIYGAPSIKTAADLKGKKAAITNPGGTYDLIIRSSLPKMGLEPDKDVTMIATGSIPNCVTAILNGAVSAAASAVGSNSIVLEANGCHPIYDPSDVPFAAASTVMQKSWAASNHAVAQRYVDSIVQAIALLKKDKAITAQTLRKMLDSPSDQVINVTYDQLARDKVTPSQPFPKAELYQVQFTEIAKKNKAAAGFDLNKMVDASFVQSAVDRHLDKG